jgi:hypothetical protein
MQKIYHMVSSMIKESNCAAGMAAYETPAKGHLDKPLYPKHIAIDSTKKEKK